MRRFGSLLSAIRINEGGGPGAKKESVPSNQEAYWMVEKEQRPVGISSKGLSMGRGEDTKNKMTDGNPTTAMWGSVLLSMVLSDNLKHRARSELVKAFRKAHTAPRRKRGRRMAH